MLITKDYQYSSYLQYINCYPKSILQLFLSIRRLSYKHREVYPSAATLGKMSGGIRRETASRGTSLLQKHGFIIKYQRPGMHDETCRYEITELGYAMADRFKQAYNYFKYGIISIGLLLPVATPEITLYKLTGETRTIKTILTTLESYKQARETTGASPNSIPVNKKEGPVEQSFESSEHSWVTPAIQNATKILGLNKWGQIRLSAYSSNAINYAIKAYENSKGSPKKDRFKWFASVCWEYCKKNNISPDWGTMNRLGIEHEIPENPVLTLSAQPKASAPEKGSVVSGSNKSQELMQAIRKKNQDRLAERRPEDIEAEVRYLAANPEWVEVVKRLGVDFSRWTNDTPKPQWSPEQKELVDWALNYIDKLPPITKDACSSIVKKVSCGPDSDYANSGELCAELKLMRSVVEGTYSSLEEKVVTEIQNQIVCASVEADDAKWGKVTYEPLLEEEGWAEIP